MLNKYGILKGTVINKKLGFGSSPHYQIHIIDDTTDYRIAINVKSKLSPSELLYLVIDDFQHPLLSDLAALDNGFTELESAPNSIALDYIRGNLFDSTQMHPLPHDIPGPDNDLNEKIDAYIQRAIADEDATIYAFGERWGPEANKKDKYFGFLPGNGIHDIHMNQGNVGRFARDNGVWQDGGLLIHFPSIHDQDSNVVWPEQWAGLFLAFQSQCWHTDDQNGNRLPQCNGGSEPLPDTVTKSDIQIVAALVNPEGADPSFETITLINLSPQSTDLSGWSISDRNKNKSTIQNLILEGGSTDVFTLDGQGAQLSNKGGIITLLDPQGIKRHGVSYTKQQARSGWTVLFT